MSVLDDYRLTLGQNQYVPIIIGGMGVDISTPELALEACRLGGIGHISDAMNQQVSDKRFGTKFTKRKTKRYKDNTKSLDKSNVKFDLNDVYQAQYMLVENTMRKKTGPGAVFINVMEKLTMGDPLPTLNVRLNAALDAGIDGITLSAGLHSRSFSMIEDHPRFFCAKLGIIVSSARALKIFLRSAKRSNRMPDYIVVEGPLAGGHLGFGNDWKKFQLQEIVAEVLAYLKEEDLSIPVIPAGGIFTGGDAVEFLNSGASAVQVATRFTIAQECGFPEAVKQQYLAADKEDVVVNSVSPTGYLMRMLKQSPCLRKSKRPMCEPFGYALSNSGTCQYIDAYREALSKNPESPQVKDKMCICYHFSKHNCYTCGHYVYRLKDTTTRLDDTHFYLPTAEQIFNDYLHSSNHSISVAEPVQSVFAPR